MRGYASILLYGEGLNFHHLSNLTGLKPDAKTRKGERLALEKYAAQDCWAYSCRRQRRGPGANKSFDYLLRQLFRKRDAITSLKQSAGLGVQNITLTAMLEFRGTHTTFQIDERYLKFAAELDANLWLDVWRTKPRKLQNYEPFDWSRLDKGGELVVHAETDFYYCHIHFTNEQVKRMALSGVSPTIKVW